MQSFVWMNSIGTINMCTIKTIISILSLLLITSTYAQQYTPVDNRSTIKFTIKNFGINVSGTIKGLTGTIHFEPDNIQSTAFNVRLDASTINTDNNTRDNHLKKEEYLNIKKYQYISFSSTQVKITGDGKYLLQGNITIKGVTKPITIPFSVINQNDDLLFTGDVNLNRRDFKVGGNSFIMSDNLFVTLSIYAKKVNL